MEAFRPKATVSIRLLGRWAPVLFALFAVATLLAALLPQFAGVKPPVVADFAVGVLADVAAALTLWSKMKKGALSTVLLVSPVGIHTQDNLGFVNRIAWPDMAKVGRVTAIAGTTAIKAGNGKSYAANEVKDMAVIGWGVREVPSQFRERLRESMAALHWDADTGKHYISIPISVIEKDWVNGRIALLIRQYRPDLVWDVRAEEASVKLFK